MEKDFIPYEQALALKKLGFDELCLASFETETNWHVEHRPWRNSEDPTEIASPLYQQAFRWFREKYDYSANIRRVGVFSFVYEIFTNDLGVINSDLFGGYEKAELECLKELIKIVKNK